MSINKINNDIINEIILYLGLYDTVKLSFVSKKFNFIFSKNNIENFWRFFALRDFNDLITNSKNLPKIENFNIFYNSNFQKIIDLFNQVCAIIDGFEYDDYPDRRARLFYEFDNICKETNKIFPLLINECEKYNSTQQKFDCVEIIYNKTLQILSNNLTYNRLIEYIDKGLRFECY